MTTQNKFYNLKKNYKNNSIVFPFYIFSYKLIQINSN